MPRSSPLAIFAPESYLHLIYCSPSFANVVHDIDHADVPLRNVGIYQILRELRR